MSQPASILCALASPSLRENVERELLRAGHDVRPAGSAPEVLHAVVEHVPDLLLLDAGLVDDSDLGLLQAIRSSSVQAAGAPAILFVPSRFPPAARRRAGRMGARVVEARGLTIGGLREVIGEALGSASSPSEGELLSLLERVRSTNPFQALGVPVDAEPDEIHAAYRELARQLHPDALGAVPDEIRALGQEAFAALADAWAKLSDPESLERYREDPDLDARQVAVAAEVKNVLEAERAFRAAEERLERQDWKGALTGYQRAVELCPDEGEYRACLAWAIYLVRAGEPGAVDEALRHGRAALKLSPNHARPPLVLGRLYQNTGDLERATKLFRRAVKLDPRSVEAVRELRIMRMREERARKQGKGLLSRLLGR